MLPRRHRVTAPTDFRAVTRSGSRAGGSAVVISVRLVADAGAADADQVPWRCGFIVSKAVGNAVVRHRTQRRLRHILWDVMREDSMTIPEGVRLDVVVRALPAAPEAAHDELVAQLRSTLVRAARKELRRRDGGPRAQ
ncbi:MULTISPECIES: ribonuclease P protein component [Nesterenkonia]|uniref:Ribonuclease P protein component n=1 Tax=Nesterenkonia xinjiangensis TaxID=225327 RepID=A0A7Z0GMQ6_9MICC|nr:MULTISPECIES: ribonuclease P protein component [Nesterenkonia]MDZ5077384.1 ribonuclease P protein component [Nesterenkonia sp. HG001]NYJ78016.1 ribonuclease P protein component [Nesterenkonia xinjiangensis]